MEVDKMKIKTLIVGPIETNCYIAYCPETKEGVVIDPGDEGDRIVNTIDQLGIKVNYIINTHGHHDHIKGNKKVKDATGAKVLIHTNDAPMLVDPTKNLSHFTGEKTHEPGADKELSDGDIISFGNISLKVLHTPGHTPGCISLLCTTENICFTGDTLFYGSVGRTDLPGGDYKTLMNSLKDKLVNLSNEVRVYPGHGPYSTIGDEKKINPYLK